MMMVVMRYTHPMFFVDILVSIPLSCEERMFFTYDLSIEKGHLANTTVAVIIKEKGCFCQLSFHIFTLMLILMVKGLLCNT